MNGDGDGNGKIDGDGDAKAASLNELQTFGFFIASHGFIRVERTRGAAGERDYTNCA